MKEQKELKEVYSIIKKDAKKFKHKHNLLVFIIYLLIGIIIVETVLIIHFYFTIKQKSELIKAQYTYLDFFEKLYRKKQKKKEIITMLIKISLSKKYLYMRNLSPQELNEIAEVVLEVQKRYDFPVEFIFALIGTESEFNIKARSSVGAVGLMQVLPPVAMLYSPLISEKRLTRKDLYQIDTNIMLGATILNDYRRYFNKDIEKYVSAYCFGITYIIKNGVKSDCVKKYLRRFIKNVRIIESILGYNINFDNLDEIKKKYK